LKKSVNTFAAGTVRMNLGFQHHLATPQLAKRLS